ncbi:MAG: hypothetical protein J6C51_06285 [Clostridia bacterium]|nr:hypothetical protein [Clostridia bacterium]
MRKNKMMRAASALLVAVLLTTSVISGTFAKYVTTADASDTARVAKFGVTVTASGSLFGKTYLTTTNDTPGADDAVDNTVTVKSDVKVVAPGTKSSEDGIEFSITGTPEVDVNVAIAVTEDTYDVFLAPGFYDDVTTGADDIAQVATKYEPVKYTLWQDKGGTGTYTAVTDAENVNLATLASKLEGLTKTYDSNTNLFNEVGNLKITWAWDIDENDLADTILGDLAADANSVKGKYTGINDPNEGTTLVAGMDKDYNLNTGIQIDITVTQVD